MQTTCQTSSFCGFGRNTAVETAQIWHDLGDLSFRPQGTSHAWVSRVWATLHGTLFQIANVPLPTAWSANRYPATMFVHHRPNLHASGLSNTACNGCGYAFGSVPLCKLQSSSSKWPEVQPHVRCLPTRYQLECCKMSTRVIGFDTTVCGCWAYDISTARSKISSICSMTGRGDVGHLRRPSQSSGLQRSAYFTLIIDSPKAVAGTVFLLRGDAVGTKHRSVRPSGRTRPRPATHMGTETEREVTCGDNGSDNKHPKYHL
jgi:hypothetical protein